MAKRQTTAATVATATEHATTEATGETAAPATVPGVALTAPVTDPAPGPATAPAPAPGKSPGLDLGLELWGGTPGKLAWSHGVICSGRWTLAAEALCGADRFSVDAGVTMEKVHRKACKAAGMDPDVHELVMFPEVSDGGRSVRLTLTAAPDSWPVERTGVTVDLPVEALAAGLPGSFFRVYVATDPAAAARLVLVPDLYVQNLGDPARLWPSVAGGGWLTDGRYVAVLAFGGDTVEAAREALAVVWTAGRNRAGR